MISSVYLPATEVISIDAMASVDTVRPAAHSEGAEHLSAEHHATIGTAPD